MHNQAVILAGGKGTRLLPLTSTIPKPMVSIAGHPFLHWQLRYLREQGVESVLLLISHLGDVIKDYFDRHPIDGMHISYSIEPSPMGTGGALFHARDLLDGKFWLLNGDSFIYIDLPAFARDSAKRSWEACMATVDRHLVEVPGNVQVKQSLVTAYRKEAAANDGLSDVDAGVYLLSKSLIEKGPRGTFDLGALWPPLIAQKRLGAFAVHNRYFDIGTPERLKFFERHIFEYF